jgi:hypothetical protein
VFGAYVTRFSAMEMAVEHEGLHSLWGGFAAVASVGIHVERI